MTHTNSETDLKDLINSSNTIVIIQADNPDGDSLSSTLALEEILETMGKKTSLYCAVDVPDYLKHLSGWDRVSKEIPHKFDLSIIVDTSANILLEKLNYSEYRGWIASKPVVVIDHHAGVKCDIPYATLVINDKDAVSTGEAIYKLANKLKWKLSLSAKSNIVSSILADSLGLSSEGTTPQTYRIIADLIESGVDRIKLDEARRAMSKMPQDIYKFKADLINHTSFAEDGKIGYVTVTNDEITKYSPLYNPAPLIQSDMLQVENVLVAIVLKRYDDGKVTGSIRCNSGVSIAADLATHYGGGGHIYAAGFKVLGVKDYDSFLRDCIKLTSELLKK